MFAGLPLPGSFRLALNPRAGLPGLVVLPTGGYRRAKAEITSWPEYAPTPLLDLVGLADGAGLGALRLKDESGRFGLGSFKALGGAYAVAEVIAAQLARAGVAQSASASDLAAGRYAVATSGLTVTTATDGNHGRSVAWGAQRFGCACVIFVSPSVSAGRRAAITRFGAEVREVAGTFDDAVRAAAHAATAPGWFLVADTVTPGETEVPRSVMQGYRLMADEALDQWTGNPPTHVFAQAGVGSMAAAVSVHLRARLRPAPCLIVVEAERAACFLASLEAGLPTSVEGGLETMMAGLACGEPCLLAWQELERGAFACMTVPDAAASSCMRLLATLGVVSGESGVAGLAGLLLAAFDPASRDALGLDAASRVLVFSTEGATDPALYDRVVGRPPVPPTMSEVPA